MPKMATFLSTPSARRATRDRREAAQHRHISIHALREEGDREAIRSRTLGKSISIHALREEGDVADCYAVSETAKISIHALREEGDTMFASSMPSILNFYPRPPRGGRRRLLCRSV